jgi:hypothetical protein
MRIAHNTKNIARMNKAVVGYGIPCEGGARIAGKGGIQSGKLNLWHGEERVSV